MWKSLILVLLSATASIAGEMPDTEHIYVASQAVLKAEPDMATIEISSCEIDNDVAKAKSSVDDRCAKVISLAEKMGIQ